jgi:hypothetical protein
MDMQHKHQAPSTWRLSCCSRLTLAAALRVRLLPTLWPGAVAMEVSLLACATRATYETQSIVSKHQKPWVAA